MPSRTIQGITGHDRIDGVVPGVRGQRSLPTQELGIVDPFVMLDHIGPDKLGDDFYVNGHMHPPRFRDFDHDVRRNDVPRRFSRLSRNPAYGFNPKHDRRIWHSTRRRHGR